MDKCPQCNRQVRQYGAYSNPSKGITERYFRCDKCHLIHIEVLDITQFPSYHITEVKTIHIKKETRPKGQTSLEEYFK